MFLSLGNIRVNADVGMLFIDFERANRMRVNGTASVDLDDPLLADDARGRARRAGARHAGLPELPALHPHDAARRAVAVRARTDVERPFPSGSA